MGKQRRYRSRRQEGNRPGSESCVRRRSGRGVAAFEACRIECFAVSDKARYLADFTDKSGAHNGRAAGTTRGRAIGTSAVPHDTAGNGARGIRRGSQRGAVKGTAAWLCLCFGTDEQGCSDQHGTGKAGDMLEGG